jgi:transposase
MISTYTLNNLGLVAGTCKELRIAEFVDSLIPPDPQQKVTTGQAVVAMIINGLGFSNRSLYLFPQFFEKKPVDILIHQGLTADDLNDDTIGRSMDRLFSYGCTELFSSVALYATEKEMVDKKFGHLDSTTFSLHGDYKSSEEEGAAIHITHGLSKMRRPDLKQIYLNLVVASDGGIPLFMQALDGNSSDNTVFRKTVTEFRKGIKNNLQAIDYWIGDCKFYTKDTIDQVKDETKWISRVPDNIKEAQLEIQSAARSLEQLDPLIDGTYSYRTYESCYGGVTQRWLTIFSNEARKRSIETVKKAVEKESVEIERKSKKRGKKGFYCDPDAQKSVVLYQKTLKYHTITIDSMDVKVKYKGRGRPSKNKEKQLLYSPHYHIELNEEEVESEIKRKAIFIIATNELDTNKLTDLEVFEHYKDQMKVEKGFRFLKDPLFFASSLFLKKPERIVALTMIMCISLLVYSICERKLRMLLKTVGESINSQVGKPTQRPTLRWVYQIFEDVHLVRIGDNEKWSHQVTNLRDDAKIVLNVLGPKYKEMYLLT